LQIILSNSSSQPIYEQIAEQIKAQIISGVLQEGEGLPSIRSLAKDLRISVITTKRAYDELEKQGFLNTVASKGCFVAARDKEHIKEEYLKQIEDHMRSIQLLALFCGLNDDELGCMYQLLKEGK
jgi:GntR family transcriptional regulator